ncbi:uncharacterized protein LOC121403108 [Xenopus laevis]|uniref:Uncharacterized protein LOC121403108 n=1 Tax=Xenopus laevis TaxID=8355 RepID=A0A8J1MXS9_XENLA|nr:uncharacterized protein LOC121403108 [Xenopus laevis]
MKIFNMHFIQCIIIGLSLLLCIYPASAVNKTIMVNESHITENWQEETSNNTKSHELFAVLNITALIISISAFVMVALPGAVGWYLYYKLRKKMAIHDVEKAMEDPQPVKFTSKISLRLSKNCFCNMFRLLCNRIKKRKTICDEESAIDKSQTTPKPSKPETITRNEDKKQKKKKDTMNKTVGEAIEMPSVQQETNEQVQTPALPKEKKYKKKKQKKKKDTINKSVGEPIEMPSVQQETNEQVQTPALPKEKKYKKKKQKKKKDTINKSVGEPIEMPSVKQETNEQVQTPALPKE